VAWQELCALIEPFYPKPSVVRSDTGNARVRRGMIQLAWRFLHFQKDSALAKWFRSRVQGAKDANKRTMIIALARKLLIALWRMVNTGEVPQGIVLWQPA
jgi:transposase